MPLWKPRKPEAGSSFELSPTLSSLAKVKEHVTVLGGLNNYTAGLGDGGGVVLLNSPDAGRQAIKLLDRGFAAERRPHVAELG